MQSNEVSGLWRGQVGPKKIPVRLELRNDGSFRWAETTTRVNGQFELKNGQIETAINGKKSKFGSVQHFDGKNLTLQVGAHRVVLHRIPNAAPNTLQAKSPKKVKARMGTVPAPMEIGA